MGVVQSTVNKVIGAGTAAVIASPVGQTKLGEIAESKKTKELTAAVDKASLMAEQSKVELPTESLAKRYPIGKNKADRTEMQIRGSQEIGAIKQSMKANQELGNSLEALYKQDPSEENFKKMMDFKATNATKNVPMQNEIQGITERLNFIEPSSIIKRRQARERAERIKGAKKSQIDDVMNYLEKNPNKTVDQLSPEQRSVILDAISGGNINGKK